MKPSDVTHMIKIQIQIDILKKANVLFWTLVFSEEPLVFQLWTEPKDQIWNMSELVTDSMKGRKMS